MLGAWGHLQQRGLVPSALEVSWGILQEVEGVAAPWGWKGVGAELKGSSGSRAGGHFALEQERIFGGSLGRQKALVCTSSGARQCRLMAYAAWSGGSHPGLQGASDSAHPLWGSDQLNQK